MPRACSPSSLPPFSPVAVVLLRSSVFLFVVGLVGGSTSACRRGRDASGRVGDFVFSPGILVVRLVTVHQVTSFVASTEKYPKYPNARMQSIEPGGAGMELVWPGRHAGPMYLQKPVAIVRGMMIELALCYYRIVVIFLARE